MFKALLQDCIVRLVPTKYPSKQKGLLMPTSSHFQQHTSRHVILHSVHQVSYVTVVAGIMKAWGFHRAIYISPKNHYYLLFVSIG